MDKKYGMGKEMKFLIKKFYDKPKYCRVPIFIGGERQIHIMQPMYDDTGKGVAPEPHSDKEWFKLMSTHGQIVISLEALEDFIVALRDLAKEQKKVNKK